MITQCRVSKSVNDFPFHEIYKLDDYRDSLQPCVFFGMYRFEDLTILKEHKSDKVVFWTGQDALEWLPESGAFGFFNVTAHPKVCEHIKSLGFECKLVSPSSFLNSINPQKLGPNIYAYCPTSAPDYHGKNVLDELRRGGYEIIIGDGKISQDVWRHACNGFYNDIFIGLCLSEFAGGGTSIIEMGLRGVKVITNVFDLPNCIQWSDAQDIANKIEKEKVNIGYTNKKLASDVWHSLDHKFEWLSI